VSQHDHLRSSAYAYFGKAATAKLERSGIAARAMKVCRGSEAVV
jgi:hypothetical protein